MSRLSKLIAELCPNGVESEASGARSASDSRRSSDSRISRTTRISS